MTSINSSNGDGAFPASINKYGNIECAGRVGIVSNLLNDNNIQHYVASAAGHVFIIVKYEGGNYSYMDPNNGFMFDFNNLKTSFVRADTGIVTDFTPEDVHNIRGINLPYENFILRNPVEGVNRAFFNNLVSAVDGQPEFQFSVIAPNPELVDKIRAIEAELLPVLSSIELELSSAENQSRNLHERRTGTINDELHIIKRDSSTASEFAEKVLSALDSESLSFPNWMNQQVFTDIKPFLEELYRALP